MTISLRTDILRETDGPMLRYEIQSLVNNMILLPASRKDRLLPRDTVITKRQLEKLSRIKLLFNRPYGLHIPFCRTVGKISGPLRHPFKQAVMDLILYPSDGVVLTFKNPDENGFDFCAGDSRIYTWTAPVDILWYSSFQVRMS